MLKLNPKQCRPHAQPIEVHCVYCLLSAIPQVSTDTASSGFNRIKCHGGDWHQRLSFGGEVDRGGKGKAAGGALGGTTGESSGGWQSTIKPHLSH